jgi:SAM-dependent methyltransferase
MPKPDERPLYAGPEDIRDLAAAFQKSRVLLSAFELGLFSLLGDAALTSAEVARLAGTDPRATDRLLNALAALGLVRKGQGLFRNTPAAAEFLVRGRPGFLAELGHTSNVYASWVRLTEAVRAGGSESSVRERAEAGDPGLTAFVEAMSARAQRTASELAALLDLANVRRMLDVGGGLGAHAVAFCRANPKLSAVVLDLPAVIRLAERDIAEAGLAGRVSTLAGDYLDADFGSGFDLVLFSAVLHINPPQENEALVRKAFAALNPGGRIVLRDHVLDEDRISPVSGALFALNMLVNTRAGDVYTESELRAWLAAAGFRSIRRLATGQAAELIVGRKP